MSASAVPNTLRVSCVADDLRIVRSADELAVELGEAEREGLPLSIVGGGSNLVLRRRLPGRTLLMRLRGLTFERLDGERWRVVAEAGETWQDVVQATLDRGIPGLENLVLIPGSVGAAPMQNIGAYGRELAEVVESVTVFDRARGALETLAASACRFRYRDSRFKDAGQRYVVVRVALRLGGLAVRDDYPDVRRELAAANASGYLAVADAVARVRRRKLPDPQRIGNVGSFFKNPLIGPAQFDELRTRLDIDGFPADGAVKVSAARLIDAAGWKGVALGAVQVWPRQPLVLVNRGGATGQQVLDMARRIRDDVAAKYGARLVLEPTVMGTDGPPPGEAAG